MNFIIKNLAIHRGMKNETSTCLKTNQYQRRTCHHGFAKVSGYCAEDKERHGTTSFDGCLGY
jgi:hypothetical protein